MTDQSPQSSRPLGWGMFLLQFITVVLAYLVFSIPGILMFGETSNGYLASVSLSMAAGLLVAWAWLRHDRAVAEAWDLSQPESWPHALLIASGATIAIIAIFSTSGMVTDALGLDAPNVDEVLQFVTESPVSLILWIVLVACLAAGLGEELLWRGFLLDRLIRLPGIQGRIWIAIFIQAVLFGLPHAYQGWGGVLITGLIGLLLGWLRIVARWNLWPLVIAHAAVDTIMMLLGYASVRGWIADG